MSICIGDIIAAAYSETLEQMPCENNGWSLLSMLGENVPLYRARLDARKVNARGRPLSRREVVEWNLRLFKNHRLDPRRLPE